MPLPWWVKIWIETSTSCRMQLKIFGLFVVMQFLVAPAIGQDILLREAELGIIPDDTAKVNLLIGLGHHYCGLNNEKSVFLLQEALAISTRLNYQTGIAYSYYWQGRVYYYKDEYDIAITCLSKARDLFERLDDNEGLSLYYFACAAINSVKGDYLSALNENQELIRLSRITGDALMLSVGLHDIGSIHISRNQPDRAMPYLWESVELKNQLDDQAGLANLFTCIGKAYEQMGKYDSAMYYYDKGFVIRKEIGDIRRIANSEVSIGSILIKLNRYDQAINTLMSASNYYTGLDEKTGLCFSNLNLALALNFKGDSAQAMKIAKESLSTAKAVNNPSMESNCYLTMAEMAVHNKHYKMAYEWAMIHKHIDDSLAQANKEEILQELETKFQVQQQNNKIDLLESHNNLQRNNILILSISMAALVLILILLMILFRMKHLSLARQKKVFEQENIIRQQEEKLIQKENQLLQEQVQTQSRQLAAKALEMLRINESISGVLNKLESLIHVHDIQPDVTPHIKSIVAELENQTQHNTWKEFDKIFKNIHTEFYQNLLNNCPDLSAAEIKIAALLRLNLSTKEIAAISYKSEEGIKSTRYRLRKKLGLGSDENLVAFLMQL
jgi:tetratricopeptide (TPR) repeat protein/DNA-binding CsgD family transcriptional regulator